MGYKCKQVAITTTKVLSWHGQLLSLDLSYTSIAFFFSSFINQRLRLRTEITCFVYFCYVCKCVNKGVFSRITKVEIQMVGSYNGNVKKTFNVIQFVGR